MQYSQASTYTQQPGRYTSGVLFDPAPSAADDELASLYPNGSSVGPERDNKQYFALSHWEHLRKVMSGSILKIHAELLLRMFLPKKRSTLRNVGSCLDSKEDLADNRHQFRFWLETIYCRPINKDWIVLPIRPMVQSHTSNVLPH